MTSDAEERERVTRVSERKEDRESERKRGKNRAEMRRPNVPAGGGRRAF